MEIFTRPVQFVRGVGPGKARLLARLGIETVEDLLYHLPWRYEDRSEICPIGTLRADPRRPFQTVRGEVERVRVVQTPRRGMTLVEVILRDGSGRILARWFNQGYLKQVFRQGQGLIVSGPVRWERYGPPDWRLPPYYLENPHFEIQEEGGETLHTGRIVPIYHETRGLSSRTLRHILWDLLESITLPDFLPPALLERYRLPTLQEALRQVHFPDPKTDLEQLQAGTTRAHKRLAYEEFLLLELGLGWVRGLSARIQRVHRYPDPARSHSLVFRLLARLPFSLTQAQHRVFFQEIRRDLLGPHPMNRLIQGDVGSGKTLLAWMTLLVAVEGGYQAALMAPTEILAEQHHRRLQEVLEPLGVPVWLLTSRVRAASREALLEELESGRPGILVGTHALVEDRVRFGRLALLVIDEQHKFGVLQRAALKEKGRCPDLLVMTATPIPRTLAMSLYGDLDLSVVDELPPGRKPVETRHYPASRRGEAYAFLAQRVQAGDQAYVVYPLVAESERSDLQAATERYQWIRNTLLPAVPVGLLHGRMRGEEKEAVMRAFQEGKVRVLVATTVVEVGVDVPQATLMLIEHAERFGLAQLHQLRGRVGRGERPAYCLLVTGNRLTEEARRRIQALLLHRDGFRIAEEDLRIRGPGEFLGTRQSGLPSFRVADLLRDARILEVARRDALHLLQEDPGLRGQEHTLLREMLAWRWQGRLSLGQV